MKQYREALVYGMIAWLLLVPPPGHDSKTPLKEWMKMGVYENHDACELEIRLHRSGAHLMFPNRGEVAKPERHENSTFETAECVPEDDARLK